MVINSKIIFLLCTIFTVIVITLFGYVTNKNTLPEKKMCKVTLKKCSREVAVNKKAKLNRCLEDRIKCSKEKRGSSHCRKQARECVSLSFKYGSTERKECNASYRICLDEVIKRIKSR